jgi:type I restriction enzyme S subunit
MENGKAAIARNLLNGKAFGSTEFHVLKPKDNVLAEFLFYFIRQESFRKDAKAHFSGTAGQLRVPEKFLFNYPIPLPPLPEQKRIVSRIEELFNDLEAGVAALERVRAGLKRYKASVLKAACEGRLLGKGRKLGSDGLPDGWRWVTVENLSSKEKHSLAIGPFGSNLKVIDYRDQGVPLVFVRNIRTGNFDNTHYITKEKARELRAHQITGGDILITKMGEPPGDACLYPESRPIAVITADCIKWGVEPALANKRFIVHMINSPVMQKQIQKITRGVAQKKVSLDRFRGLLVPLPPLDEQKRIVSEVERRLSVVGELESTVEAGLLRAGRLRQAILRSAFEGRL